MPSYERRLRPVADNWPGGVSDGLVLPCVVCEEIPRFDYTVSDHTWLAIVPPRHRHDVVCLPCFDRLAVKASIPIAHDIQRVQFTGTGYTVVLEPTFVHEWAHTPCG